MYPRFTVLFPISYVFCCSNVFVNALHHFIPSEVSLRLTRKHIFYHSCIYNDVYFIRRICDTLHMGKGKGTAVSVVSIFYTSTALTKVVLRPLRCVRCSTVIHSSDMGVHTADVSVHTADESVHSADVHSGNVRMQFADACMVQMCTCTVCV